MATPLLNLKDAIEQDRLPEFIAEQEARGVKKVSKRKFDKLVKQAVKEHPPQGQTSGSRARGGSSGKKTR